jgi:hypothetical protein
VRLEADRELDRRNLDDELVAAPIGEDDADIEENRLRCESSQEVRSRVEAAATVFCLLLAHRIDGLPPLNARRNSLGLTTLEVRGGCVANR